METINFLLWYASSKLGDSATKVIDFEKKVVSFIKRDINSKGGIGGIPIEIDFVDIPHELAGHDENAWLFYKELLDSKNYSFIRAPGAFGGLSKYKIGYLESIKSDKTIIFSDTLIPPEIDLINSNIIDMRSNAFTDPDKSFVDKVKTNLNLLNKNKCFYIANFGESSPVLAQEQELRDQEIYLFNIDKNLHKSQKKLQDDLTNYFKLYEADAEDLINIGLVPVDLKQNIINSIHNINKNIKMMTGSSGSAFLDYKEIKYPILLRDDSNYDIYLSMESLIEQLDVNLSLKDKQICNQRFTQFEIPLLIKKLSDRDSLSFSSYEDLVEKVSFSLNKTDGKNDVYMGISKDLSFKDNKNNIKTAALVELALPSTKKSSAVKTLYKDQLCIVDGVERINSVISFNIDVERITNVSIEDGIFGAEFYLDITSQNEDPINSIKFNNLSSLNPKHEVRRIEHKKVDNLYSGRYIVTSNFDFNPIADNYPFDEQFIYIAVTGTDENSQVQPVPEQYLDVEFKIDGWSLIYAKCGINRKKNWIALNSNLQTISKINEEIRLGWELKRENSMTLLKIGIPLFFLYILLYYTLFVPVDQVESAFNNINLAFLSSIALYFSTERPQPLKMTTIDVVFAFFYIMAGISLISIVFVQFYPEYYDLLTKPLRFLLPVSIIALGVFIKRRLSSKKYKPSITK